MSVFVTGATGVLGHRLVDRLDRAGHTVFGLVRDEEGEAVVEQHGGIPIRGDVLDRRSLDRCLTEAKPAAIVHAATSIPTETKPPTEAWAHNDRIRYEGARNLLESADGHLDQFIFPSVVWLVRQPDGSHTHESAPINPDRGTTGAAEAEGLLRTSDLTADIDVTILRFGLFYAHDAASTRRIAQRLIDGEMPVVGSGLLGRGDAELARIHATDAARAVVSVLAEGATGTYHVVDDQPVSIAAFLEELADRLEAPDPGPRLPRWLARFVIGSVGADLLGRPVPTSNEPFKSATGWEPNFPTVRDGLAEVVERWETEGTIRREGTEVTWTDGDASG